MFDFKLESRNRLSNKPEQESKRKPCQIGIILKIFRVSVMYFYILYGLIFYKTLMLVKKYT